MQVCIPCFLFVQFMSYLVLEKIKLKYIGIGFCIFILWFNIQSYFFFFPLLPSSWRGYAYQIIFYHQKWSTNKKVRIFKKCYNLRTLYKIVIFSEHHGSKSPGKLLLFSLIALFSRIKTIELPSFACGSGNLYSSSFFHMQPIICLFVFLTPPHSMMFWCSVFGPAESELSF